MATNTIYGPLKPGCSVILATGSYNKITGVLCYGDNMSLRMVNLDKITAMEQVVNVTYEVGNNLEQSSKTSSSSNSGSSKSSGLPEPSNSSSFSKPPNSSGGFEKSTVVSKPQLTFRIIGTKKYLSYKTGSKNPSKNSFYENNSERELYPAISSKPCKFTLDYSPVEDKEVFAGALLNLTAGGRLINWNIEGDVSTDVIALLPTTWYENYGFKSTDTLFKNTDLESYQKVGGLHNLITKLQTKSLRGYTRKKWASQFGHVDYCEKNEYCGNCYGKVKGDSSAICIPKNPTLEKESDQKANNANNYYLVIIIIIILLIIGLVYYFWK